MTSDSPALLAATFLAATLDLPDDPATLAGDLREIERVPDLITFLVELVSATGSAAFLIYAYPFQASTGGASRQSRFADDVELFETVARLDTPGPRAVAHATIREFGFILATTPDVVRALTGADTTISSPSAPHLPLDAARDVRAITATDLTDLLRQANALATTWLGAVAASAGTEGVLQSPAEIELALLLLNEHSIRDLLRMLDTVLSAARAQHLTGASPPP